MTLFPISTSTSPGINFSDNGIGSSCSIFTIAIGDTVYFGNNEDYKSPNAYQWYIPSQNITTRWGVRKEIYGGVFLGFDNNGNEGVDTWPQGGMNEHGLCFDANGLPNLALRLDRNMSYPYSDYAFSQILWECKTVEDVTNWYQTHRWSSLSCQIHYADKSGDAVVVSVNTSTGKWVFTRKNATALVSTNFNLDDPVGNGHYPCSRYTTATLMLGEITTETDLTVSACANVLYEVHQEGTYATKYSNIFDPVNLDLYFNYGRSYGKSEKIGLMEHLTDKEAFEQEATFFGVTGLDGYISVKTVKIGIPYRPASFTITVVVIVILLGVVSIPTGVFIRSKIRRR